MTNDVSRLKRIAFVGGVAPVTPGTPRRDGIGDEFVEVSREAPGVLLAVGV